MKKFGFYLAIVSFALILSCSKNSNDDAPTEKTLTAADKRANQLDTGDSANDILSNDSFTKLQIEIAYVAGFRPTQTAMDEFSSYLREHTFKQEIELIYSELTSPNLDELSLQQIDSLEMKNRTAYNKGETLAVYIYFADAPSDEDDEDEGLVTLGAVFRNTSMVIHEVTVKRLANLSARISTADVEGATINHEFGHLFGLVNLGTDPVNDHEDADAANHCNVEGCLMRAELQFGDSNKSSALTAKSTSQNEIKSGCSLSGNSVLHMLESRTAKGLVNAPGLDPECVLDLQANGGR